MKKALLIGCALVVAVFLIVYGLNPGKESNNYQEESKQDTTDETIDDQKNQSLEEKDIFSEKIENPKIALVAPDGSKLSLSASSPKFGCNDNIVFKEIAGVLTPKQILEAMFVFEGSNNNDEWYYNVFENSDLVVDSLSIDESGLVRVELSGDLLVGGVCDNPRVSAQIDSTLEAMEIMTIKNVEVLINGELVQDYLSEKD